MRLSGAGWGRVSFVVCLLAGGVLCAVGASATPPLGKKAQALGFAAADCSYCHNFDLEHMRKKAAEAGLPNSNCVFCHGKQLPKNLHGERGKWLLDEKIRRKAKAVDVAWLREYPVKDAKPAR